MKIATYNVTASTAGLPLLLNLLTKDKPDVVCLQELKAPQERFPAKDIRALGYDAV